jgi:hypothetical protein
MIDDYSGQVLEASGWGETGPTEFVADGQALPLAERNVTAT